MTNDELAENTMSMRAWAISRIEACRAQELKFGSAWEHREKHHTGPPQALVEAWTERRALQAVLREIGLPYETSPQAGNAAGSPGDGES